MTTDRSSRTSVRPEPRLTLTTQSGDSLLTGRLAATYALAWVAFGSHLPGPGLGLTVAESAPRDGAVWLDDLPPAERPAVAIPRGWTLATRDVAPTVARVPVARRDQVRVRTRSS